MKMTRIIPLLILVTFVSACSTVYVTSNSNTRVKQLVEADVFEVLPKVDGEIAIYNSTFEIEGEYLELATVEIEDENSRDQPSQIFEHLMRETKLLGGNGILLIKNDREEMVGTISEQIHALAIFELDRVPQSHPAPVPVAALR